MHKTSRPVGRVQLSFISSSVSQWVGFDCTLDKLFLCRLPSLNVYKTRLRGTIRSEVRYVFGVQSTQSNITFTATGDRPNIRNPEIRSDWRLWYTVSHWHQRLYQWVNHIHASYSRFFAPYYRTGIFGNDWKSLGFKASEQRKITACVLFRRSAN